MGEFVCSSRMPSELRLVIHFKFFSFPHPTFQVFPLNSDWVGENTNGLRSAGRWCHIYKASVEEIKFFRLVYVYVNRLTLTNDDSGST